MRGNGFLVSYLRWSVYSRILLIVIIITLFFGTIIHFIEPATFPTIFDGIWWVIVTTATIGYGDYVPETTVGRIVGMLLIFIGTGIVTTYFVTLAAAATAKENAYIRGEVSYKGKEHIVIIGWNERSRTIIDQLSMDEQISLIDESLTKAPDTSKNVHFIQGNPTHDAILLKANICDAKLVLITADQGKNEQHSDSFTILTILAIKGLCPSIYCIAEILTNQQINNAKRAGADEIIKTNFITSFVMYKSIISNGLSQTLTLMLSENSGHSLTYMEPELPLIGKNFFECSEILLKKNLILIGVRKGEEVLINPSHNEIIEDNNQILVITKSK